jgi:acyl transferase domain-containing protein
LATTRAVFPHRAALLQADRSQLIDNLSVLARGESGNGVVRGTARPAGKMAFLFSGQGSQRAGMGRELHGAYPVFAEAFDEICAEFDRHLDLSLRDVMFGHAGTDAGEALDRTEYTQPALFAFAVAMYRLWEFWGVRPDFVAGHSIGEFTAAHVAGVFDLSDAVRLVCARGRLMQHLPAEGAMVAVQADEEEVSPLLNDAVGIAAVNGRGAVVVSGAEAAVASLSAHFTALGRRVRRLKVSHAFHSPLMDPILDEFRQVAARVTYREPDIAVVSGVTGLQATAEQLADPGYWSGHARMAVRFADQIEFLQRQRVTTYLEIGPDAVLTPLARAGLTTEALVVPAQRRDRAETWASAAALAQLQVGGVVTDPAGIYAGARQVPLPTYAFQHERYWLPSAEPSATLHSASRTPAESRLWESLDKGDLDVFAQAVGAAPDTPQSTLAQAFALLSTWRRDNESTPGSHEVDDAAPYIELSPDFADLTPEEQRAQLSNVVRDGAARVLGHASRASVPVDADLMDLGFASLTVLELASALGKTLGIEVAATTIYDFATPADLAMHLAERIAEQARKTA